MGYGQERNMSLFGSVDKWAILLYLSLVAVGLVAVFSASWVEGTDNALSFSHNYIKQIVFLGVSLVVGVVIMCVSKQ